MHPFNSRQGCVKCILPSDDYTHDREPGTPRAPLGLQALPIPCDKIRGVSTFAVAIHYPRFTLTCYIAPPNMTALRSS